VCAFNDGYALHEEEVAVNGTSYTTDTAAFKMNFVFVTQKSWSHSDLVDAGNVRNLKCKGPQKLEKCCSATAFQGLTKVEKQERKDWCKNKGCSRNECPKDRRRGMRKLSNEETQDLRSLQLIEQGIFTGTDFNDALGQYTSLEPVETGAVLDATNLEDVTVCRTNNYNVEKRSTYILYCKEYDEKSCDHNDYIIEKTNDSDANLDVRLRPWICSKERQQRCCGQVSRPDKYCIKDRRETVKFCRKIGCDFSKCRGNHDPDDLPCEDSKKCPNW
jgi:hypothetical protein